MLKDYRVIDDLFFRYYPSGKISCYDTSLTEMMFSKQFKNTLRRMDMLTEEYVVLTSWKYLRRILLLSVVLAQWYLLWKLWTDPPIAEILGEVNGFAPSCKKTPPHAACH